MHFLVEKGVLVKVLANIQGAVERKNTVPILSNVKIEAKDGKLNLTATDMDIVVISNVHANIKQDGVTTVPAQLFYDIVRKIPDGSEIDVNLNENGNSVSVKYGKSDFKLPCLSADDFPVISEDITDNTFKITSENLLKIIDKAKFAISNDETRYYLNGIYLHTSDDESGLLKGATTDGHRLALVKTPVSEDVKIEKGVIIPKKTVNEIKRILDANKEEVTLSISKNKIKLATGDTVLISKLIDGEFPDYKRVIPQGNDKIVKINKKDLSIAIDRVATISTDKHRSVKLTISDGLAKLQAQTSEGGAAHDEVKADYFGESIETGFNSRYLLDILNQIDSDNIVIKFKDGSAPSIIQDEKDEKSSLYVLMPIRV